MKTLLSISLFLASVLITHAQVRFGFQAGSYFANQSMNNPRQITSHTNHGLTGGLILEVPVSSNLSLRPQMNFTAKNFFYRFVGNYSHEYELAYFQVPVNLIYGFTSPFGKWYLGGGPIVSKGTGGWYSINNVKTYVVYDGEVDSKLQDLHYKKLDFGVNGCAGFQSEQGVFIDLSYEYGLINVSPEKSSDVHNMGLSVKVGYIVNKNSRATRNEKPLNMEF
jgi:hypothetical protein